MLRLAAGPPPASGVRRSRESRRSKPYRRSDKRTGRRLPRHSTVAAVRVAKHPRSPVLARSHRHPLGPAPRSVPTTRAMHLRKSQSFHKILNSARYDDLGSSSRQPPSRSYNAPQRGHVQMVHVGRASATPSQSLVTDPPSLRAVVDVAAQSAASKTPIDQDLSPMHLKKKRRVPDKGYSKLVCSRQLHRPRYSGHRHLMALAHQPPELPHLPYRKRSASPGSTHSRHQ